MPVAKGPEVKASVLEMTNAGKEIPEIAKELGVSKATVYYHLKEKAPNPNPKLHKLTDSEIRAIKNYSMRGLKARHIKAEFAKHGKKMSLHNIYKAVHARGPEKVKIATYTRKAQGPTHEGKLELAARIAELKKQGMNFRQAAKAMKMTESTMWYWWSKLGHSGASAAKKKREKFAKLVTKLHDQGLSYQDIAKKTGRAWGTVRLAYLSQTQGGVANGNAAASSTNGAVNTNHKGWTLESVAGACSAEVTRVITGFSDTYHNAGAGITPEKIQRRVIELLATP